MNHAASYFFINGLSGFWPMACRRFLVRSVLIILVLFAITPLFAQDYKSLVSSGNRYYEKEQFYNAAQHYQVAVGLESGDAEINFRLAESYRLIFNYALAALYYQNAIQLDPVGYPLALFHLARMQKSTGRFKSARDNFQSFIDANRNNQILAEDERNTYLNQAQLEIKGCDWALKQINLGWNEMGFSQVNEPVNTEYNDYAVAIAGHDTLITITSGRKGVRGGLLDNRYGEYFTDNLRFEKKESWSEVNRSDRFEITNTKYSDGAGTYNKDHTKFYFTSCYEGSAYCQLYVTSLVNGKWRAPRALNENINATGYDNRHPTLSADGNTLIFVSNRPGGSGGYDLWLSKANGEDNWQSPEPLPAPINTVFNEATPYYHEDGTLFFSSNGHIGLGGLDILMVTNYALGNTEITNLGIPFNSGFDDNFFTLGKRTGYLSSNRAGSLGKFDIYQFNWPGDQQSIADFIEESLQQGEQLRSRIQEYNAQNLFAARDEDQFYYDNLTAEERAQFDRILTAKRIAEGSFDPQSLNAQEYQYYQKLDVETKAIIERLAQRKALELPGFTDYQAPSVLDPFQQSDWEFYQNSSPQEKELIDNIIAAKIEDRQEFLITDLNSQETDYWNATSEAIHQRIETKAQIQSIDSLITGLQDLNAQVENRYNENQSRLQPNQVDPENTGYQQLKQQTKRSLEETIDALGDPQRTFYEYLNSVQQDDIHRLALRRYVVENQSNGPVLAVKYGLNADLENVPQQYSSTERLYLEEIVDRLVQDMIRNAPADLNEDQQVALLVETIQEILQQHARQNAQSSSQLEALKSQLNQKLADSVAMEASSETIEQNIADKMVNRYFSFVPRKLAPKEAFYFNTLPPEDQLRIERLSRILYQSTPQPASPQFDPEFLENLSAEDQSFLQSLSPEQQEMATIIVQKGVDNVRYSTGEMDFLRGLSISQRQRIDGMANQYQRTQGSAEKPIGPFEAEFWEKLSVEERAYLQSLSPEDRGMIQSIINASHSESMAYSAQQQEFLMQQDTENRKHLDEIVNTASPEQDMGIPWESLQPTTNETTVSNLSDLSGIDPVFQEQLTTTEKQYLSSLSEDQRVVLTGLVAKQAAGFQSFSPQEESLQQSIHLENEALLPQLQRSYQQVYPNLVPAPDAVGRVDITGEVGESSGQHRVLALTQGDGNLIALDTLQGTQFQFQEINVETPLYINWMHDSSPVAVENWVVQPTPEKQVQQIVEEPADETAPQVLDTEPQTGPVVYFDFDRYQLRPESKQELQDFFDFVRSQASPYKLLIAGHTDYIGSSQYNQWLSEQRGKSVSNYLITLGADPDNLSLQAKGESQPKVSDPGPYGRQWNRRVELFVEGLTAGYSPDLHTILVKPGSQMALFAKILGVPIATIMQWNGVQTTRLRSYQPLRLPSQRLADYRHLVYHPRVAYSTSENDKYYYVEYGDTFYSLAKRYGTTVDQLVQLNGIQPKDLKAGQQIRVR